MFFQGSSEEMRKSFINITGDKEWRKVNEEHFQFRHELGGILNWYPKTGKIAIQGKWSGRPFLEREVKTVLQQKGIFAATSERSAANAETKIETQGANTAEKLKIDDSVYRLDHDSELVIGLVAAVGTDLEHVTKILQEKLKAFNYGTREIRISKDVISTLIPINAENDFDRINDLMTAGNEIRSKTGDKSILAKAAAAKINQIRCGENQGESDVPLPRQAFIINSLKQPDEVQVLRRIYSNGFFLIGVHASESRRTRYLRDNKNIVELNVQKLIKRDVDESEPFGQHTRDTYHLSDFFIDFDGSIDRLQHDLWRIVELIFGKPFVTPTFDEFAMFMAFSASLKSADLSRQVGAVVTKNEAIVATGANDVPKFGGGQYWPSYQDNALVDTPGGRDYTKGEDSNVIERKKMIESIVSLVPEEEQEKLRTILSSSSLKNITEYGRIVHAEMDALLSCARENISTKNADLYCTTFPCHNCAKHIVASGIKRVVYVEPYPKSKALDFHQDSITLDKSKADSHLVFEPFVGVGPRSFFNLFSISLGSGYAVSRKDSEGKVVAWDSGQSRLRMQMLPVSYIERERSVAAELAKKLEKLNGK